jgi:hypothetical protein
MTELERLEEALTKFFTKNPKPSYESVFKAGIKFGIAMQASNNLDYESTYWIDAKEKQRIEKELSQLCGDVSEKISKFMICAIKIQIEKKSYWSVEVKRSNLRNGEFDDDVSKKCGIQLSGARKDPQSDDINLEFTLGDKLGDLVSKYSSNLIFTCDYFSEYVEDASEGEFTVDDFDELRTFYYPHWKGVNELDKDQLVALLDELEKQLLMLYMTTS